MKPASLVFGVFLWALSLCGCSATGPAVAAAAQADRRPLLPGAPPATKAIGMMYNYPSADPMKPNPPPGFFVRSAGALAADGDAIEMPPSLPRILYEGELVIVIGRQARRVAPDEARECILGYTCGMDGSPEALNAQGERDVARSLAGKSADGIAPIGPRIVKDVDWKNAKILLRVNGQVVETSLLRELVWDPPKLVSEISKTVALEPGDVIFSGATRAVPQMQPGDTVEVEITGVGTLKNRVAAPAGDLLQPKAADRPPR